MLVRRLVGLSSSLFLTTLLASACSTTNNGGPDASVATDGGGQEGSALPPPPADGGSLPDAAGLCTKPEDCPSKVCLLTTGRCLEATCRDGVLNGDETDMDCGGSKCSKCDIQKSCKTPGDCASGVCIAFQCRTPSCTDKAQNGAETDVDCGGTICDKCDENKKCGVAGDCKTDVCTGGKCVKPFCSDGVKNNAETDVDCGGPACPRCTDNKGCLGAADCRSGTCTDLGAGLKCQPATCTDGKKNGAESDVDCGGPTCPGCVVGRACVTGTDCASKGCNYKNQCAVGRSCTARYGGDTCGFGGAGSIGPEAWEDCCVKSPVTTVDGVVLLDKYQVTAGRMRVFLESIGYNVRSFVQTARAANKIPDIPGVPGRLVLEPAWDAYLPTSFNGNAVLGELEGCSRENFAGVCIRDTIPGVYTAASRHLGGFIFQQTTQPNPGCYVGEPGTHAFRFPAGQQDGPAPEHSQDVYDTKSMQCVDYLVAQAFCVWDGGRLEALGEWQAAIDLPYPWSAVSNAIPRTVGFGADWTCHFPWVTDDDRGTCTIPWVAPRSAEYAAYLYNYEYPKLNVQDYIVYISAPGRTRGRGPGGHADVYGNAFELTSTVTTYNASPISARHRWSGNGTWETNVFAAAGGATANLLEKTNRLGLRCAYP